MGVISFRKQHLEDGHLDHEYLALKGEAPDWTPYSVKKN